MAGPWWRGPARRRVAGRMLVGLCCLTAVGCLASSPPEPPGQESASTRDGAARIELCVQNDGRLPATIQFFRDGDRIGPPVHAVGFSESCRSAGRSDMVGTLDVRVDPVAPDGVYFPESLRAILVSSTTRAIRITLVAEGIELYGQSSYRIWEE